MTTFEELFYDAPHRICQKWEGYFPIYERHFSRFRSISDMRMLEIGVSQGGSLDLWRRYFGHQAIVVGIDIEESCRRFEAGRTFVRIGSQEDPAFLKSVVAEFGPFDIILDDGGHTMRQQIVSFETLYPGLSPRGVYLCEDCHTSYHPEYGGGVGKPETFIEFAKARVDDLNGYHIAENGRITETTLSTTSIAFYESVVVFEKSPHLPPRYVERGG